MLWLCSPVGKRRSLDWYDGRRMEENPGETLQLHTVAQWQEWRWENIMIDNIFGAMFMDDL